MWHKWKMLVWPAAPAMDPQTWNPRRDQQIVLARILAVLLAVAAVNGLCFVLVQFWGVVMGDLGLVATVLGLIYTNHRRPAWAAAGLVALTILTYLVISLAPLPEPVLSLPAMPALLALTIVLAGTFFSLRTAFAVAGAGAILNTLLIALGLNPYVGLFMAPDALTRFQVIIVQSGVTGEMLGLLLILIWLRARHEQTLRLSLDRWRARVHQLTAVRGLITRDLTGAVQTLTALAEQQETQAHWQLRASQQAAASTQELALVAEAIGGQAAATLAAAAQMLVAADQHAQAQDAIMVNIGQNQAQLAQVQHQIDGLAPILRQLEQWSTDMQELASNTHLIALNATIEAAGAGEAGVRFGVIAQEIRALNAQTRAVVEQVQAALAPIRQHIWTVQGSVVQQGTLTAALTATAQQGAATNQQLLLALREVEAQAQATQVGMAQHQAATAHLQQQAQTVVDLAGQFAANSRAVAGTAQRLAGVEAALQDTVQGDDEAPRTAPTPAPAAPGPPPRRSLAGAPLALAE